MKPAARGNAMRSMKFWWAVIMLTVGLALPARPLLAAGCETVPESYRNLKNPVSELTKRQVRYWSKQYRAKCARCHGENGDGGGEEAAQQKVPPAIFTDKDFMTQCSDGQLFYQINFGGEEKSAMPGFGPESSQGWSEQKIWQMAAFIRRFAR